MAIIIYTDGSSLGNPGPGGWAFVCDKYEEAGNEPDTTNNRMEILAVIKALEYAEKKHIAGTLAIHTDSNLVFSTMTQNWKKKTNNDLWDRLELLRKGKKITWHKVKAHRDNALNNKVDELARNAAFTLPNINGGIASQNKSNMPTTDQIGPGNYFCSKCNKETQGLLGINRQGTHIRVDCPTCRSFIKFAPQTTLSLSKAKKRVLLTESEIEQYAKKTSAHTISISKPALKGYTKDEVEALFGQNNHTLF